MRVADDNLTLGDRWWRMGVLAAFTCVAFGLRAVEPGTPGWLPVRTSCGAISGLPCLFCGMTRAMHHLLNAEFGRALYLNWLVLPLAVAGFVMSAKLAAEITLGRRFSLALPRVSLTPRSTAAALVMLFALWAVQASLAIAFRKHELLNPNGLLYSLFLD
ncbi:MAG TPA: DUF2752 domain-containing protein [Chthoniobacterales bacterium]